MNLFCAASAALARASSEANLSSSLVMRLSPPPKQPKHIPIFDLSLSKLYLYLISFSTYFSLPTFILTKYF